MPIAYRIEVQEQIIYLTVTGDASVGEWEHALRAILADPAYVKGFNFLTDRREQSKEPPPDFALKVLRFLMGHLLEMGRYRWATVTPWQAPFGTRRMFSVLAEEADIHVDGDGDHRADG